MDSPQETYHLLMSLQSLAGLDADEALSHLASLIDFSSDLHKSDGLLRAIELSQELQNRPLSSAQIATYHYFLGNAWQNLRALREREGCDPWEWEREETEKALINFRRALAEEGVHELPTERLCQILTNLANLIDGVGRFVEAIEYWDNALEQLPEFGMARGNRAVCLTEYAIWLYDDGHRALFLKRAHGELSRALSSKLNGGAGKAFDKYRTWIESVLKPDYLNTEKDLDAYPLGGSEEETQYRRWCLENRLFVNPLNDLGAHTIAARDVLTTPSIVVGLGEGPYYLGYFNQMKQEFVSARYLYFEGINASEPHFSDREVYLYNTLDYPCYSLSTEKAKAAFRMAYSLFDKIAFFLNHYLRISMPERQVSFRRVWYESGERKKGLRADLQQRRANWSLRGLFWLSKDLFEDRPGFSECLEPDAQQVSKIRNHLEHRYLKLHDVEWVGAPAPSDEFSQALADNLAFSLYRRDFEAKTLRLLKTVRAALIYLSLAIHWEEGRRAAERGPDAITPPMFLDEWEDEWKF